LWYILCRKKTCFVCGAKKMLKLKENIVRQKIAETGYSVKAWAENNGFAQGTLSGWITGARNIKRNNLEKLAAALRCDIFDIATIVMEYTGKGVSELEADREEITGLFGRLSEKQRKAIIKMADIMVETNIRAEQLEIGE
jgi:transcriptional regulator with XRE-family HTH domain